MLPQQLDVVLHALSCHPLAAISSHHDHPKDHSMFCGTLAFLVDAITWNGGRAMSWHLLGTLEYRNIKSEWSLGWS